MGGETRTNQHTTSRQETNAWEPAQDVGRGILNQLNTQLGNTNPTAMEDTALTGLTANAQRGNPFTGQIGDLASEMFKGGPDRTGMVNDAYSRFATGLEPTLRGDFLDPNTNPFFGKTQGAIADSVMDRLNSSFAMLGRTGSPDHYDTVSRGVTEAIAPTFANVYENERGRQLQAQGSLYGAGNTTAGILSGLDQTALNTKRGGIDVSGALTTAQNQPFLQMLQAESMRRGIPMQQLAQLTAMGVPLGSLGGISTGEQDTTMTRREDPTRAIIGGAIGGLGMLAGMPGGLPGLGGMGIFGNMFGGGGSPNATGWLGQGVG